MNKFVKFLLKFFGVLAAIYALLFVVFWYDLDGKLMYYVVEPFMVKRFDNMKKRDITEKLYTPEVK